jgi:hypothetical protein
MKAGFSRDEFQLDNGCISNRDYCRCWLPDNEATTTKKRLIALLVG